MAMRPRYGVNPNPGPRNNKGRQVRDDITGEWTYEDLTTIDDSGLRVISDNAHLDWRPDLDFTPIGQAKP